MTLIGITYIRPVAVPAVHNAVQQLLLLRCTQKGKVATQFSEFLIISVAHPDPGSSAFLTPGSGIGKKSISESVETKFFG
jgi:hypothetical protein